MRAISFQRFTRKRYVGENNEREKDKQLWIIKTQKMAVTLKQDQLSCPLVKRVPRVMTPNA